MCPIIYLEFILIKLLQLFNLNYSVLCSLNIFQLFFLSYTANMYPILYLELFYYFN